MTKRIRPVRGQGPSWAGLVPGLAMAVLVGCGASGFNLLPVANQHGRDWVEKHGQVVKAAGGPHMAAVDNGMKCIQCHTAVERADGTVPRSPGGIRTTCFSCHPGGPTGSPHIRNWRERHGSYVQSMGGFRKATVFGESCDACHTAVRSPDGTVAPSRRASHTCFSCHDGPFSD